MGTSVQDVNACWPLLAALCELMPCSIHVTDGVVCRSWVSSIEWARYPCNIHTCYAAL